MSSSPQVTMAAKMARIVPSTVVEMSSRVTMNILMISMIGCFRWKTVIGMVQARQARVMRSVACQRPGVGANSRRRNSTIWEVIGLGMAGASVTGVRLLRIGNQALPRSLAGDRHDGRRADAEAVVRVFHLEP